MVYNLYEIYSKYKGTFQDIDGVAGAQCVDWVKIWIKEGFGIRPQAWGNAIDYYRNFPAALSGSFYKIPYTDELQFFRGDIIVWSTGKWGHVAVATGNYTADTVYSYDQNFGKDKKIREVKHNRSNILGVLRPKRYVYKRQGVNIRTRPSLSGKVIGELEYGDKTVPLSLHNNGKWAKIGSGKYISYNFLNPIV